MLQTVPSQDMVLGLYYMTKEAFVNPEKKIRSRFDFLFCEVNIALNEGRLELNAR
jgi:DNA-directed RNA polymerase subunit beta'